MTASACTWPSTRIRRTSDVHFYAMSASDTLRDAFARLSRLFRSARCPGGARAFDPQASGSDGSRHTLANEPVRYVSELPRPGGAPGIHRERGALGRAASVVLDVIVTLWTHSNTRLPPRIESVLRYVVVTPDVHRIHHSAWKPETNSNYGAVFPWWDLVFGTFRDRSCRLPFSECRTRRDGATTCRSRCDRAVPDRATGTCPRGHRARARMRSSCGKRHRPRE